MRVLPAYFEKSTITSLRSAGAKTSECLSTFPTSKRVGSVMYVVGCAGMTAGAGRTPPSEPMAIQFGPAGLSAVSGVGMMLGSVWAAANSDALRATSVPVLSATYHDRFQARSLAAFRMRKRYDFGWSVVVG